jgi:hypothetical protein
VVGDVVGGGAVTFLADLKPKESRVCPAFLLVDPVRTEKKPKNKDLPYNHYLI